MIMIMLRGLLASVLIATAAVLTAAAAETAPAKAPVTKPAKPAHVSRGEPVQLADYVVPGKTIIFDFYSDFCGPCVQVAPVLAQLHQSRDDVVVVKVDINRPGVRGIDWKSPVAQQFRLNSIPHFKVYGPNGKLLAEDGPEGPKARMLVGGLLQ